MARPSFSAKWTFLWEEEESGVEGAERALRCVARGEFAIKGADEEDFREDLRGFPFDRRTGWEEERETKGGECGDVSGGE